MTEKFTDLFAIGIEYPGDKIGTQGILPIGTLYSYVSHSFLNGLVNYGGKPLLAYVITRYQKWDEPFEEPKQISIQGIPQSFRTKREVFDALTEEGKGDHGHLGYFQDDVLLLTKIDSVYWFFWFDCDVSDCSIGRFKTNLSEEQVKTLFEAYVKKSNAKFQSGDDEPIEEARAIPLHYFRGWLSF